MKKHRVFILLLIFIFFVCALHIYFKNSYKKKFEIISVVNTNTLYQITFSEVKSAKAYRIIILDDNNNPLFSKEISNSDISINLPFLKYGNEYIIDIYATLKNKGEIEVNNPYSFIYNEPTLDDSDLLLHNNQDYILSINGDVTKKDYYISLNDESYEIKKELLKNNKYTISKELFSGLEQILTVKLISNNETIDEIKLYSNISPISDINIIYPQNDSTIDHKDIKLTFSGGDNATNYYLELYHKNQLIKSIELLNKEAIISKDFFLKKDEYTIKIKGIYNNYPKYTKEAITTFKISNQDVLMAPYFTKDNENLKDKLIINNPNSKGKIYYKFGDEDLSWTLYKEPLSISDNQIIQTMVKNDDNTSSVNETNIKKSKKEKYKVLLNYSNENELIGNLYKNISSKLKENNNISIYELESNDSLASKINSINSLDLDLYLNISTANSVNHDISGIETWINDEKTISYNLAWVIQKDLESIYPNKEGKRGIRFANNSLYDLRKVNSRYSIKVILGYLDNETDEEWLNNSYEKIEETILKSIESFFDLL